MPSSADAMTTPRYFKIPVKIQIDGEAEIRAKTVEEAMTTAEGMSVGDFDWLEERIEALDPRKT